MSKEKELLKKLMKELRSSSDAKEMFSREDVLSTIKSSDWTGEKFEKEAKKILEEDISRGKNIEKKFKKR
jgi:hypothetical protein